MNATVAQKHVMGIEYQVKEGADVYFSADVETDGPIPGLFSILSFALVFAGTFDGERFIRPLDYRCAFYSELRPISDGFDPEALRVNGLDRGRLSAEGKSPKVAMEEAGEWVTKVAGKGRPVLVCARKRRAYHHIAAVIQVRFKEHFKISSSHRFPS